MREPPKLAIALLKHLSTADALAGDLNEAYGAGKSAWWYWWQVLSAVLFYHPRETLLLARGVVVGWIVLIALRSVVVPINVVVMGRWALDWFIVHLGSHPFVMLWATELWMRPLQAVAFVVCGWIVSRTHRQSRWIVVSTFMATVLVRTAWVTSSSLAWQRHIYAYNPYQGVEIGFIALPLLILVGGWLERPRETQRIVAIKPH